MAYYNATFDVGGNAVWLITDLADRFAADLRHGAMRAISDTEIQLRASRRPSKELIAEIRGFCAGHKAAIKSDGIRQLLSEVRRDRAEAAEKAAAAS